MGEMSDFNGEVARHVSDQMMSSVDYLAGLQSEPVGKRTRTPEEMDEMWNIIADLPREARQSAMVKMAKRAGHEEGEKEPCELCKFVGSRLK